MSTAASTTLLIVRARTSPSRRSRSRTVPDAAAVLSVDRTPGDGRISAEAKSSAEIPTDQAKMVAVSGIADDPPKMTIRPGPRACPHLPCPAQSTRVCAL